MEALGYAWSALTTTPAIFAAMGGVIWGILGGALPGISPSIAMALLLPFTGGDNDELGADKGEQPEGGALGGTAYYLSKAACLTRVSSNVENIVANHDGP